MGGWRGDYGDLGGRRLMATGDPYATLLDILPSIDVTVPNRDDENVRGVVLATLDWFAARVTHGHDN
jgi:hypothetical protein